MRAMNKTLLEVLLIALTFIIGGIFFAKDASTIFLLMIVGIVAVVISILKNVFLQKRKK
jgi:hypothetical protein